MSKSHFHQCPVPSCRHIWAHVEPSDGWRNKAHFDQYHTCPKCEVGKESFKCDESGKPTHDWLGDMIAYEQGELTEDSTVDLFQHLVNSGLAWTLQGHYGRTARALIGQGLVQEYRA